MTTTCILQSVCGEMDKNLTHLHTHEILIFYKFYNPLFPHVYLRSFSQSVSYLNVCMRQCVKYILKLTWKKTILLKSFIHTFLT